MGTLQFVAAGFLVVLLALALLWAVSALIGRLFSARGEAPAAATPKAPAPPPARGIPPAHVAAISAVVAAITDGRGRIVTVRAPAHLNGGWASEGRWDQLASHRVRWDWAVPGPPHVEHPVNAQGGNKPDASHERTQ